MSDAKPDGARRDRGVSVIRRAVLTAWRADRRGTLVGGALQVVGAVSALAVVAASKLALDSLLSGDTSVDGTLLLGLAVLAVASALSGVAGVVQSQHQRVFGERVAQQMWRDLLDKCARVDLATWESTVFMARLDRVRDNALGRPTAVMSAMFSSAGASLTLVSLIVVLFLIHPLLIPVLVIAGVPTLALSRVSSRTEFSFATSANRVSRTRMYVKVLLTSRRYAAEIRSFPSGTEFLTRHSYADETYLTLLRNQARRRQIIGLGSAMFSALALAVTLILIVVLVDTGRISLAEAGAGAIAARLLASQLGVVFGAVGVMVEAGPFLQDLEAFLAEGTPLEPEDARSLGLAREVRLDAVSFNYPGSSASAVAEVSLVLPRGKVIALVGENGSGKSTLAKIVAGLYEPDLGALTWDGAPPRTRDLRASVAVLFQDFIRYQMTVEDNISIADTARPPDQGRVVAAARAVDLDRTLTSLPSGYETFLGVELQEGADLSGGQWQRLALARALYRDSPVVVLDEPTSAMDPRAEHDLFADVRRILAGRTALLISHRYSSVRLADYIYVLDAGRVVEEGTHVSLVEQGGRYAELYGLQAAAYLHDR